MYKSSVGFKSYLRYNTDNKSNVLGHKLQLRIPAGMGAIKMRWVGNKAEIIVKSVWWRAVREGKEQVSKDKLSYAMPSRLQLIRLQIGRCRKILEAVHTLNAPRWSGRWGGISVRNTRRRRTCRACLERPDARNGLAPWRPVACAR